MKKIKTAVSLIIATAMLFTINVYAADNSNFLEGYQTEPDNVDVYCANLGEISDLTKEQFEVSMGGKNVEVTQLETVDTAQIPMTFYCMVDISGSMNEAQMKQAKDAMKAICDGLREQDNMVIASLGNEIYASEFLSDKNEIHAAIDAIKIISEENTNLYEGIVNGIKALTTEEHANTKKCLLVMSDGKDYQTTGITKGEAEQAVVQSGISVYTIATLKQKPSNAQIESAKVLGSFARLSTGGLHVAPVLDNVDGTFAGNNFLENAKKGIVLSVDSSEYVADKDELLLRVIYKENDQSVKEDSLTVYAEDLQYTPEPEIVPEDILEDIPEPELEEEKMPTALIVGIIAVVIIIIVLVIILSSKKKKKENIMESNVEVSLEVNPVLKKVRFVAIGYEHIQINIELQENVWTTLGRDTRSQIVFNEADKKLSGIHFSLCHKGEFMKVKDENSSNGTFVNGVPIVKMGIVSLAHNQKLRVGSYEYRVLIEEMEG